MKIQRAFNKKKKKMIEKKLHWRTQLFLNARTNKQLSTSLICKYTLLAEVIENPVYTKFTIPKKSGGFRIIQAPDKNLKRIQKKLSFVLNDLYIPNGNSHGFVKKSKKTSYHTLSNAKAHVGKNFVWNIDITDFFSSIPTAAVAANLMEPPFKFVAEKAKYIALLICYKKQLPTGSPCSPIVSNIVCNSLDKKMQSWVNELNKTDENLQLVFTRYADDITFSSSDQLSNIQKQEVYGILAEYGFAVNAKKNREQHKMQAQWVTGIKVNEKPNLDRKYIRNIRAVMHQMKKNGLEESTAKYFETTQEVSILDMEKFVNVIKGRIAYLGFVKGKEDANYMKFKNEIGEYVNICYGAFGKVSFGKNKII
jgi:RNA-directed DNA polymerase